MKSSSETDQGPIFVIGMWRSGTSLLYTLLNQHPHIALMYEGDLPLLWPLFRNGKSKADWAERWEFWNGALSRHQIDIASLPADVPNLPTAMELVYRRHAGLARWGCKSPNYYDGMVRLAKAFPTARFIVIFRDPFDICRSVVRAGQKSSWFAKPGMALRALLGYLEMKKEADRLVQMGVHIHQLQYEDLVRDPNLVLSDICRFLQVPFDPRMTSLEGADRSAIYEADHHAGVKGKKIFTAGKREEVLPASLKRKVQRYVNYWHREFGGMWPVHPSPDSSSSNLPSLTERMLDTVRYRALRAFDQAVVFLYCFAPIGILRFYRGLKHSTPQRVTAQKTSENLHSATAIER
jgi:hypothetical protein